MKYGRNPIIPIKPNNLIYFIFFIINANARAKRSAVLDKRFPLRHSP